MRLTACIVLHVFSMRVNGVRASTVNTHSDSSIDIVPVNFILLRQIFATTKT